MMNQTEPTTPETPTEAGGQVERVVGQDNYDVISAAFDSGLSQGEKYLQDMFAKFGTLVPTPGNKYEKGTDEFRAWGDGFAEAIRDWFNK